MILSQEIVKELLDYKSETGKLTWRLRGRHWFKTDRQFNTWNTRYAGKGAFESRNHDGYCRTTFLGRNIFAHVIIFIWMTGEVPDKIDHENHIRDDNRWSNLKPSSYLLNSKNVSLRKNSKTGYTGVTTHGYKYRARVICNGTEHYLGLFDTAEQAHYMCISKRKELGFHINHGR